MAEKQLVFFLGGADAEMHRIRDVLVELGAEFHDKGLGWGAKAFDYWPEIGTALSQGKTPVLLELPLEVIDADHHGPRAGEPATLLRVLDLVGKEPTRLDRLIAANDAGYIPAMLVLGATAEEVAYVRSLDRSAQGITPEQEVEARRAIATRETEGRLTLVRMSHSKTATVCDRLHVAAGGAGYDQLLILSGDGEANFYGRGDLVVALEEKFKGWSGGEGRGDPAKEAFWGGYPSQDEVLAFVREYLSK